MISVSAVAPSSRNGDPLPPPQDPLSVGVSSDDGVFICSNEFLAQQLSAVLRRRVNVKSIIKCKTKPKCLEEKLQPLCDAMRLHRKEPLKVLVAKRRFCMNIG